MTAEAATAEQRPGGSGIWVHLAMTAVSLAILGGIVLWQVRSDAGEAAMPAARSAPQFSVTPGSTSEGATPRGGPAELDAAQARAGVWTVYVVESEARAQAVGTILEGINGRRQLEGQPPLNAQVVWFDSTEAEDYFWQGVNLVLRPPEHSAPSVSVIDLRGW